MSDRKSSDHITCREQICKRCGGRGMILTEVLAPSGVYSEQELITVGVPCPECGGVSMSAARQRKARANIPEKYNDIYLPCIEWDIYRDDTGAIIDTSKAKARVTAFIEKYDDFVGHGKGLYIWSKMRGSGKTFIASAIANELLKKGVNVIFESCSNLLLLDQSKNNDSYDEYERDPIKRLCDCELLILDDIGQKKTGLSYLNDVLFRIVYARDERGLPIILTSNCFADELDLDDRVVDRINARVIYVRLPECCIRAEKANIESEAFLRKIGLYE